MQLRDNPAIKERGKLVAKVFARPGKAFHRDDVWAYVKASYPQLDDEWAREIEAAAWRELETEEGLRKSIVMSYNAVRDKADLLFKYVRALSVEDAEVLHDYLAGKR